MNEYECKRERGYNESNSIKFIKCTHKCSDRQTLYHTCYGCECDNDTKTIGILYGSNAGTKRPGRIETTTVYRPELSKIIELEEQEIEQYLYY